MRCPCWMKDMKYDKQHGVLSFRVAAWYLPLLYAKALWHALSNRARRRIELD